MSYKRISPIPVAEGGTGSASLTNTDGVVYYDGTNLATTTVGSIAQVLTSNGTGVAPTFQTGTTPANNCAFFAYKTSSQPVTQNTSAVVSFGTIVTNLGTVFASGTFTVPTSGKLYYLHARVMAQATSNDDQLLLYVNGSAVAQASNAALLTDYAMVDISIILPLDATNTVSVVYKAASSIADAIILGQDGPPATPYATWFEGYQLN
jgi:hypothetical protein